MCVTSLIEEVSTALLKTCKFNVVYHDLWFGEAFLEMFVASVIVPHDADCGVTAEG